MSAPADTSAKLPLRTAMEARDVNAVVETFAPEAILHSPLTSRLAFQGSDQIRAIIEVVLGVFDGLRYTDELRGERSAMLVAKAHVGGKEIEMVDHMRLDEHGRIVELTVFFRPLPAIAVAMRLIGSGLGRRRSNARGRAIGLLTRPLGTITELGDRAGVRLVGPTL